ncbi:unnamed protein product, partial [Discosporangium mesarthrocarpum]
SRLRAFIGSALADLSPLSPEELQGQRYERFRALGSFDLLSSEEKERIVEAATGSSKPRARPPKVSKAPCKLVSFLAKQVIHGERSAYKGRAPAGMVKMPPTAPNLSKEALRAEAVPTTAKGVLDMEGPEAMASWVRENNKVLVTDTTMRDAHQSLLATRVRTVDLVKGAKLASELLNEAFSFEV